MSDQPTIIVQRYKININSCILSSFYFFSPYQPHHEYHKVEKCFEYIIMEKGEMIGKLGNNKGKPCNSDKVGYVYSDKT